ncbi:MAG: FAD-binding oxidoreductase, partial [Proteobacteria bacterium]|nr:FAD-binding oxidoreductase [Pseudomonadota bacterium]
DRILAFDPATGVLRAEAGLSLAALDRALLPRGFASPVVPGTEFVTLGGLVACDVHGKNHHTSGTFGRHVRALRARVADGRVLELSESNEPELFLATPGGLGLTCQILEVEVQLARIPSPWLRAETSVHPDIDSLVAALRESSKHSPYPVAWSDTTARGRALGRGVLITGDWAEPRGDAARPWRWRAPFELPVGLPSGVIAPWSIRLFNSAVFALQSRRGSRLQSPRAFFHPLDVLGSWNRAYGARGFVQYQCVVPIDRDPAIVRRLFEILVRMDGASAVSVVKDFGAEGRGTLSFPRPGITIALDLPMRGAPTQALVDRLNDEVAAAGGRIYLAKDALTRAEHFRAMEPRLPAWNEVRRKWDPNGRLRSGLSVRLLGDEP